MNSYESASYVYAPTANVAQRTPTRVAETGTTETVSQELPVGVYCSIRVGAEPIRVTFNSSDSTTDQVATTDMRLPGGSEYPWVVDHHTTRVHVEAADGAAVYEAWIYVSGK